MKTYSAKPSDITRTWYILDAKDLTLGRLSTKIATLLLGKNKPEFTKHIDCGDYVIVLNSDQLVVTGKKMTDKSYFHHSNYPGGIKEIKLQDQIIKDSTQVIIKAVKGMIPDNRLKTDRLARLKVYSGEDHPHMPQKPVKLSLKGASNG